MKRYIIVGAGEDSFSLCYKNLKINENDIIVACDGGLDAIVNKGLLPNIFVGDQDSLTDLKIPEKTKKYFFNPVKDKSDLELAIDIVLKEKEEKEILLFNFTGNRLDHFLSTVNLLKSLKNENIFIIDKKNKMFIINQDKIINKDEYKYISFFNIENDTIISLKGFKYELNEYHMNDYERLCLSNEIINKGIIKTNKSILVIESNN